MPANASSFIARDDIESSIFVKLDPTNDHAVIPCGADDEAVGVSHEGTREAPITGITPLAAADGEHVAVYTDTWPCEVIAAATIVNGDRLKPNASGHAIVALTGEVFSATARAGAASGERCKCTVGRGTVL